MSQYLPYDEIEHIGGASVSQRDRNKNSILEDNIKSQEDSEIGNFVEGDLSYLDKMKQKRNKFHLLLKIELMHPDDINDNDYLKRKPNIYTPCKTITWERTDKINYLIQF